MDVQAYMENQWDNCINEIDKQEQIIRSKKGSFITVLGLLALFRKGYYSAEFETLQISVHKMLRSSDIPLEVKGDCFHQSLALMYSEN